MKVLLYVVAVLLLPFTGVAQNCNFYFPSEKGRELGYTYFSKSGKAGSSSKIIVTDKKVTAGKTEFNIAGQSFDKKGKELVKFNYLAWCENGIFCIDMKSMMATMNLENMSGFKIESDNMQFPSEMKEGQKLNDASIKLTVDGPVSTGITLQITNRKVDGFESVTTPAGTFDCVKISYNTFSKVMIIKTEGSAVEWYCEDVGLVRSESYDKRHKLLGYNELTSIN